MVSLFGRGFDSRQLHPNEHRPSADARFYIPFYPLSLFYIDWWYKEIITEIWQ